MLKTGIVFLQSFCFYPLFAFLMPSDFSTHHVSRSSSKFPWGIIIICLLFLSFLLWSKWDKISSFFSPSSTITNSLEDSGFVQWDPISLEGDIRPDGDFITHTHTLLTQSSGVFWLKSKLVNLNQYTWYISLEGVISSQYSGLVIIDVTSVTDLKTLTWDVATGSLSTWETLTGLNQTWLTTTSAPVSLSVLTGTTQNSVVTSSTKKPLSVQEWIQQFPILIGTGILFSSSRGHTILFPSKKISFSSINLTPTNFGIKWLRCYSQMNVVEYSNKAQLTTAPSLKIYECTNASTSVPSQFASISLDDGRVFLIEATDPAWGNFANAIEITGVAPTN